MQTNQIYTILNDLVAEGIGVQQLTVADEAGLVSLGNEVLSSDTNTSAFLNKLVQRVGRTIIRYRKYRNRLSGLILDDFEWGAIVQKVRAAMPSAEADQSYDLVDGQSVDHYKIAKPDVRQKLFVTRTPYQYHITRQDEHLQEAFTSVAAMESFIAAIFGEVRNAIELGFERLARNSINNMIAECYGASAAAPKQNVVNLGTLYRTINSSAPSAPLELLNDNDFLRFAVSEMNTRIDMLQDISVLNMADTSQDALPTFTPKDRMHVYTLSNFKRRLETVVQYAAFNEQLVDVAGNETLTYLQAAQDPMSINIKRASDGTTINAENIVGMIYDRDACGAYKWGERVSTTPMNSAGLYFNTYYHLKQLWFNDLSENFVLFTLN